MHWSLLLYPLTGAFAGFVAGLLGLGGGVVVVPALTTIFLYVGIPAQYSMHFALGTSMATIVVTQMASLRAHIKKGQKPIILKIAPPMWLGLSGGTIIGVLLASRLSFRNLSLIFVVLIFIIAVRVLIVGKKMADKPAENTPLPAKKTLLSWASIIGISGSLLGLSGGAFFVPLLQHFKIPLRKALAVSASCGLLLSFIGTVGYMVTGSVDQYEISWSTGYIYWPAFLGIVSTSMFFAPLGVKLAHVIPEKALRYLFVGFLIFIAIRMFMVGG